MITHSDLQKWQTATTGINESGQTDLLPEEWSALITLNESLQNSNFESVESRNALILLKGNLRRHDNNQTLQMHLQNFINLCEQHSNTGANAPVSAAGNINTSPVNTSSNAPKDSRKKNNSMRNLIIIAVLLIVGYFILKNTESFGTLFSGGQNTGDNYTLEVQIPNGSQYSATIDSVSFRDGLSNTVPYNDGCFTLKLKDVPKEKLTPIDSNMPAGMIISDPSTLIYVEEPGKYIYAFKNEKGKVGYIFSSATDIDFDKPPSQEQMKNGFTVMALFYVDRKCEISGSFEGSTMKLSLKKGWNKVYLKLTINGAESTTTLQSGLEWRVQLGGR